MYENFKLCPELQPSETCLVLEQYVKGRFDRRFHMHVPKSKLTESSLGNLLRSLVIRFYEEEGMGAEHIVQLHLANRRKSRSSNSLNIQHSYPEPGVLRFYCGTNTVAWADQVIVPSKFRSPRSANMRWAEPT